MKFPISGSAGQVGYADGERFHYNVEEEPRQRLSTGIPKRLKFDDEIAGWLLARYETSADAEWPETEGRVEAAIAASEEFLKQTRP